MKKLSDKIKALVGIISVVIFTTICIGVARADDSPPIMIAAINPGYTVNGSGNIGEMILLKNMRGDGISLAGYALRYIGPKGDEYKLLESFPENSEMRGEFLQLRLASTGEAADLSYTKTLAMDGALQLLYNGEKIDEVCWTGGTTCKNAKFNSDAGKRTTLVRDFGTLEWEHKLETEVDFTYDAEHPGIYIPPAEDGDGRGEVTPVCTGLEFSEILSYYENDKDEQFIELYNSSAVKIRLDGCTIRYKNKKYALSGIVEPEGYYLMMPVSFAMTKNPNSSNMLEIVDVNGAVVDKLVYYHGQKKGTAYAQFGYKNDGNEQWLQTYAPTPGEENNYQQFKSCEEGKVINEATGNCVKASTIKTELEACPAGKYRNPLTGRCKSYPKTTGLKECAEGYERNPETNRCRKIRKNTGADYGLNTVAESYEETTSFVALGAIATVAGVGVLYVIWQFRKEIGDAAKRVLKWGERK